MKEELIAQVRRSADPGGARNLAREYLQARILLALQETGAMIPLAFRGGTALRFLYNLPRFSEDLDFALERPDRIDFDLTAAAQHMSARLERVWSAADAVVSSLLLYAETAAALAQAERLERIDAAAYRVCMRRLDALWDEVNVIRVNETLVRRAGLLARAHRLRAYDAVHCAAAERVKDSELVVASGDPLVLAACEAMGLAVSDTSV